MRFFLRLKEGETRTQGSPKAKIEDSSKWWICFAFPTKKGRSLYEGKVKIYFQKFAPSAEERDSRHREARTLILRQLVDLIIHAIPRVVNLRRWEKRKMISLVSAHITPGGFHGDGKICFRIIFHWSFSRARLRTDYSNHTGPTWVSVALHFL